MSLSLGLAPEDYAILSGAYPLDGKLYGVEIDPISFLGGGQSALKLFGLGVKSQGVKGITKFSLKRVKRLIKNLSDNSKQNNGLSQEETDKLKRMVERAGGRLRNDGVSGIRGSSAGKPHVQTEGLSPSIDRRHIWTQPGVQ